MNITMLMLPALFFASCVMNDTGDDKAELMKIHKTQKHAHISKNAELIVDGFSDNFLSVNRGKIDSALREDHIKRFQNYFDAVKFKKWDDVNPPIIRFSDDHSLAYMIVDKLVVLEAKDSLGMWVEETTHFAWLTVMRKKRGGDWKVECVASTNEPEILKPL